MMMMMMMVRVIDDVDEDEDSRKKGWRLCEPQQMNAIHNK